MAPRPKKYALPDCIKEVCEEPQYTRWLHRKAMAHVRRDKRRGFEDCKVAAYKERIHSAVRDGGHLDYYTGRPLDWSLISKFRNEEAKTGRSSHKKKFWMLPTVDHTFDDQGRPKFVICSWQVNDAKGDLTPPEFRRLCQEVLDHNRRL